MSIKKVWLDESQDVCIACGLCESLCPSVFEVPTKMVVKPGVDVSAHENDVREAASNCPTGVIHFE